MANVKGNLSSFLKLPFLFKSFFQHYISGFAVWRVDGQMTCHIETLPCKTGRGQMTVPPNSMTKLQSLTQKKSNFAWEKAKLSCLAGWLSFALPQAKLLFFCVKDCNAMPSL